MPIDHPSEIAWCIVTIATCSRSLSRKSGPDERSAREVERTLGFVVDYAQHSRFALFRRKSAQVHRDQTQSKLFGDHLARDAALRDQSRPQHFMSADELVDRPLQRRNVRSP